MIEVETQTTEVEVINNIEVISAGQVEVETVDLSDLDITVAKKEYVITGDDIYIPMLYDDAPQWMKDLVQLVVDVSISSGNQNLINDLSTMLKDFAVSYVPLNQYTQSILDLGDEDTRINALIETLNSNFNDGLSTANAQIISLQLTKASKDEVVAQVIQTIAAQLADGTSNIGSIIGRIDQAIANETSARATSFQVLTSSLKDTSLDIAANATATHALNTYVGLNDVTGYPNGTGLLADVSAIASDVTTLNTNLQSGAGTWASADSNLTNSLSTSIINGDVAVESKFAYNSIVNINGVYKKSGFGLTTNYTSGNGTQANPYVSEFWIDASRLKFTNSAKTGSKAPFTIQADGATPEIYFNGVVSFSNVNGANMSGSNLLYNSAPAIGFETKGWQADYNTTGIASSGILAAGDPYRPTGGGAFYQYIPGTPEVGKVFDIRAINAIPVIGGQFYEGSAYLNSHRCDSQIYVGWLDSAGSIITWSMGSVVTQTNAGSVLSTWGRSKFITQAPANAASCYYYIRGTSTGQANPYVFASMCYFGRASEGQSVFSNWSEGISAGATTTGELTNDSGFTTLGAVASQGYVLPAGVANAINTNTTTINGSKITTGSITAGQIQAGSVSADRLTSTNGSSTVWAGGGLISANFNGNVVGNIGSPTAGFRLSSNAAGTLGSNDPNIYGAYILGSIIDASSSFITSSYLNSSKTGSAIATKVNPILYGANYSSGFLSTRFTKTSSYAIVSAHGRQYIHEDHPSTTYLEYTVDGGTTWVVLDSVYNSSSGGNLDIRVTLTGIVISSSVPTAGYMQFRTRYTVNGDTSFTNVTIIATVYNI